MEETLGALRVLSIRDCHTVKDEKLGRVILDLPLTHRSKPLFAVRPPWGLLTIEGLDCLLSKVTVVLEMVCDEVP